MFMASCSLKVPRWHDVPDAFHSVHLAGTAARDQLAALIFVGCK